MSPSGRADSTWGSSSPERRCLGADLHDLGRAPMVDRQPDDLDAGEPIGDVPEERRIGPVEAVDRLRRVADHEQVVDPVSEQVDEPVLERVEVLRLVDQHVAIAPAGGGGELGVATRRASIVSESRSSRSTTPRLRFSAPVPLERFGDPSGLDDRVPIATPHGGLVGTPVDTPHRRPVDLLDELVEVGRTHQRHRGSACGR